MKIKLNNWVKLTAALLILFASLSSCVKNRNDLATDFTKVTNVIDFPNLPSQDPNGFYFKALAFNVTPDPQEVKIYVELGGPILDKDVQVTLVYNPTALTDYNIANTDTTVTPTNPTPSGAVTHFVPLPDSAYTLPNLTVTIKKGERLGFTTLTIFPNKVDLSGQYAIPLQISDAQGIAIAANLKSVIYAIVVKNDWDGDYTVTGWFFHPTGGRAINTVKHLSTINGVRVQGGLADLGATIQFDVINNAAVNYTNNTYARSGFMSADNPGGVDYSDPSNGGHVPGDATFNSTIYNNTYDPATQTFYLHYGYVAGAGAPDQSAYSRQIYEKWVRK